MTIQTQEHTQLDTLATLIHSLSDTTRLAIIHNLATKEARVSDLVERLGLAQSTISAHIACLKDCGLVKGRPEGRQIFYSLTTSRITHLLHDAEAILEQTNQAVTHCSVFGDGCEC